MAAPLRLRQHRRTRERSTTGITKLDLSGNSETTYIAQTPGNSFCEPVFTPRPGAVDEDDGWLLSVEYCRSAPRGW